MIRKFIAIAFLVLGTTILPGQESLSQVFNKTYPKLVKLYGAGGIRGLAGYGTGVVVSPDGLVLTVNNHLIEGGDLVAHLYDGTRVPVKVVAREPELDAALLKLGSAKQTFDDLPFFDLEGAVKAKLAAPGDPVLAFSNAFQIATRDEPVTIMQGNIASYGRLFGKIGIFDIPFSGNVYVVDAITNNPGSAGGALTDRKGDLLGFVGREVRNELTNTWVNYAIPLQAQIDVRGPTGITRTSIMELVRKKEAYRPAPKADKPAQVEAYTGMVLVSNLIDRTPPFVEEVVPGSPAALVGIRADDLIVYVDGIPVPSIISYRELMARYKPGDKVRLDVRRRDQLVGMEIIPIKPPEPPKQGPGQALPQIIPGVRP
jgi:serine protease Do